jgi:uncharacterized membrane protein YfcA
MNTTLQYLGDIWTLNMTLAALVALPSGVIQGYAGFGGALVSVPFFVLLFGPVPGFAMVLIVMFLIQASLFPKAIGNANWKEIGPLAGASAVTMSIGILFLVSADPTFIKKGMGVFILAITLFMISGWKYTGAKRMPVGIATGAVAGGITGSFGVPAFPLSALYFHTSQSSTATIRANVLMALLCNLIVGIVGLTIQGIYDQTLVVRTLLVAPIFIGGAFLGQYLFSLAPVEWFKRLTYGILIVSAVTLLVF